MFVREWMTQHPITVLSNTRLGGALSLMSERKIRRLAVVDGNRLLGIITKSDIYAALGPLTTWDRKAVEDQVVETVMTPDPITVAPGDTLEQAAVLMLDRRISGLPVVDKKKLVGMITETDIFRAFIEIMGIREGGARISLNIPADGNLLQRIQTRVGKMVVRSLITRRDPITDAWHAVVRVRGRK